LFIPFEMSQFNEDQISEFQETFSLFDNRGDGKIFANQLGEVLRAMGQNPTEAEVKKCGFSQEPDKRISFETFLPILSTISKNREKPVLEDFIEGFRVFDKEQNGFIHSAELRHLLTNLGERLTDEEVNELLQGHEDSQGNVNYEEFVKGVLNG
jgi:myosin light chain 6